MTNLSETASVPNLREITGFLVIYDLTGISRLSVLFPSLTVIRGQYLISNFALVIRSTSLKYIELPSLRLIQRGGVRVDTNANLCYVRTVNWSQIVGNQTSAAAPIRLLSNRLICPDTCSAQCGGSPLIGASSSTSSLAENGSSAYAGKNSKHPGIISDRKAREEQSPRFCWSSQYCQTTCSPACTAAGLACEMENVEKCCHPECLAGCYGPGANECVACKGALHQQVCVSHCPPGTYLYQGRRCVTDTECFNMSTGRMLPPTQSSSLNASITPKFAIYQGACVNHCPTAHQPDNVTGYCVACGNECPRIHCHRLLINSLESLSKLKDCYSVKDLYISIHEGDPDLIKREFDAAFATLREVKQSFKIVRALALTSLSFLRNLHLIGTGQNQSANVPVLLVRGNDNLLELWSPPDNKSDSGLTVASEGLVHFILNRNLCPKKVFDLVSSGALHLPNGRDFKREERELAKRTNGKMNFCERTDLPLEVGSIRSTSAELRWLRLITASAADKPMSALALIFYQATEKNVTFYSGQLSCGEDPWKMMPSSCSVSQKNSTNGAENGSSFCSETLRQLRSATRYAVYVETKQLFSRWSNISNIIYFTTEPSNTSPPRLERLQALNDSSILVKWLPPVHSNEKLDVYLIWFRAFQINKEDYIHRDFCFSQPDWLVSSKLKSSDQGLTKLIGNVWSINALEQRRKLCSSLHSHSSTNQCDALCEEDASLEAQESLWTAIGQDAILPMKHCGYDDLTKISLVVVPENAQEESSAVPDAFADAAPHSFTSKKKSFNITLANLLGFTQYIVELQVCQEPVDNVQCPMPPWKKIAPGSASTVVFSKDWSKCLIKLCSPYVSKTQRTLFTDGNDNIPTVGIRFEEDVSGTMNIYWNEPEHPNGVILYYVLRYRRLEGHTPRVKVDYKKNKTNSEANNSTSQTKTFAPEHESPAWSSLCVSRLKWQEGGELLQLRRRRSADGTWYPGYIASSVVDSRAPGDRGNISLESSTTSGEMLSSFGGAKLLNLLPGSYELQIMSVSLAGNSSWTEPQVFEVVFSPQSTLHGRRILVTTVCLSVFAVLLALLIAGIVHRIRKKRLEESTWHSTNPEYWHVYEVDDWEMQLEDIDTFNFRHVLGRGNFGMVYRGFLKNLQTPARSYCTEYTNIPVAIKTLSETSTVFDRRDFINEACYMKQFQSFHLVRFFGVVSKGCPSVVSGQKKIKLSMRRLFSRLRNLCSMPGKKTPPIVALGEHTESHTNIKMLPKPSNNRQAQKAFDKRYGRPPGEYLCEPDGTELRQSNTVAPTLSSSMHLKPDSNAESQEGEDSYCLNSNTCASISCCLRRRASGKAAVPGVVGMDEDFLQKNQQHFSGSDSSKLFSQYGPFAVMELMENGDLATYLRKLGDSGIGSVSSAQAYLWAVHIADGMAYLERKKYVHRDLAARNCLVDHRGVVKIGDFGLCRDIYERNYYHKVGAGKLPVRWMAPESLKSAYFTSQSDVWSFGVVLWEILTMACLPYQGKSHEEVFTYVIDGNTLISDGAPINCPPLLQSLMLYCWAYRPSKRPTFLHLITMLAPRFADAEFRQASYYYQGDAHSQLPPPSVEAEKKSVDSGNAEFTDLPTLLRMLHGQPDSDENSLSSVGDGGVLMCPNSEAGFQEPEICSVAAMEDSIDEIY